MQSGPAALRLLRVLNGEALWPPPVWLMRQAGRYLPEYRQLRAEAGDFIRLCLTPDLATEVTLQPIRRYGFDAAILFSDILMLPHALGHGLSFQEGEGPVLPKLRSAAQLAALDPGRAPDAIAPILQTVRQVRAALPAGVALIGFAGSPFTVACYMVEGGGSKDFPATRLMAWQSPELFAGLIEMLTGATIDYLDAQVDAGADTVMLFDSWAGILPPTQFQRWVIAPTQRIVATLRQRHPGLRIIGFPRLAGTMLGAYARTGVAAIGLDTAVNPSVATHLVPGAVALQGNLDPMLLVAGGDALDTEAISLLHAMRGRPHIFNLGHGIVPQTPPEHVAQLVERIRNG
jgi:uroporphyrinogen decarboxylase